MSAAGRLATADAGVKGTLAALEQRLVRVAVDMKPQEVSNTAYGFALLGREPGVETRAALEVAVAQQARDMKPQEVSNTSWAFATLRLTPGAETRAALEAAVVRVAPSMEPQHAANTTWSFATLGLMPGVEARAVLEAAVVRVGPDMVPQAVSNTAWSFATLGLKPGAATQVALEVAVVRVGPDMVPQAVSSTAWSFATLGSMPGAEVRAALEAAVVRVGPGMNAQGVANTVHAYATLGLTPGGEARAALEAVVVRVGPSMTPQAVANTLWSFPAMAATRSLPLPACYPSLWRLAHGLDVGSLKDVHLRMMFHAHLMLTEPVGGNVRDEVTFPEWIMLEAREAWMRQVRDDVTVSSDHKKIAKIIGDLGVRHEVERLSDDGYFSIDVFLLDNNVAIEFDGPTHFNNTSDGGEGGAPGGASHTTKRPSTELRDMFLGRRYRTVLSMPWFEWAELNDKGAAEKKVFVAEKLRSVGVSVPA
jgi:hypothetical protein